MLSSNILSFLRELKDNNNREWFNDNRPQYEAARDEFIGFVAQMIIEFAKIDEDVRYVQPKECIFRINRDIRFSPNKMPYKTNLGAYIVNGGRHSKYAGYYIHIEPDASMFAGGLYLPEPKILEIVRKEIYNHTQEFKSIINDKEFIKHYTAIEGSKLKTVPKGFPKDFEDAELLKFKDYSVIKMLSDKMIESPELVEELKISASVMYPFNYFFNSTLHEAKI